MQQAIAIIKLKEAVLAANLIAKLQKHNSAFGCDNSSYFRARITKFEPIVYHGTLRRPIENGVD